MPNPEPQEEKSHYISRCIREVMNEGETDSKAAAGKCYGMWDQAKKKAKASIEVGKKQFLIN